MSTVLGRTLAAARASGRGPASTLTLTQQIYSLISDGRCGDALRALEPHLAANPASRAALSLSAYCCYRLNDHDTAAAHFSRLAALFPRAFAYRAQWAYSLYRAGRLEEAGSVAAAATAPGGDISVAARAGDAEAAAHVRAMMHLQGTCFLCASLLN